MCDPFSVTASVLTVISAATQTCETLAKFFRSFRDASKDIEHYLSTLQALQSTLASIAQLEKETSSQHLITKELQGRLAKCGVHLQAIENLVRLFYDKLGTSRADNLWVKMKWSTTLQRQKIEKHMARVESHCMMFSLDLLLLNTWVRSSHRYCPVKFINSYTVQ